MPLGPSLPNFDMLMVKETQREVEKRRYSRSSCDSERKKVQGCVSQNSDPMNYILRKAGELGLSASSGHTMKFSGRTWYETEIRERKGDLDRLLTMSNAHVYHK